MGLHASIPVKVEEKFHTGDYVRMGEGENADYLWECWNMPHKIGTSGSAKNTGFFFLITLFLEGYCI